VGRVLEKYKMGKFIQWEVVPDANTSGSSRAHELRWEIDEPKRSREAALDGCYIIRTDVPTTHLDKDAVVAAYKSLGEVERAFRNLKTVQLEVRPVYHKNDDRIRGHVFLCTLAYYVQWHMLRRLSPLFQADGKGGQRRWSFGGVIERLKLITQHDVSLNGVQFKQNTAPDEDQQTIIDLLKKTI